MTSIEVLLTGKISFHHCPSGTSQREAVVCSCPPTGGACLWCRIIWKAGQNVKIYYMTKMTILISEGKRDYLTKILRKTGNLNLSKKHLFLSHNKILDGLKSDE